MRFKRLSTKELEYLEEDFIKYLIVNGIDAGEWLKIKEQDIQKRNDILDEFSDYIHFTALCHCQFLTNLDETKFTTIQISNNHFNTYTLNLDSRIENDKDLEDFIKNKSIAHKLNFTSSKIEENREDTIFKMIEEGYNIDKGHWYRLLAMQSVEIQ